MSPPHTHPSISRLITSVYAQEGGWGSLACPLDSGGALQDCSADDMLSNHLMPKPQDTFLDPSHPNLSLLPFLIPAFINNNSLGILATH